MIMAIGRGGRGWWRRSGSPDRIRGPHVERPRRRGGRRAGQRDRLATLAADDERGPVVRRVDAEALDVKPRDRPLERELRAALVLEFELHEQTPVTPLLTSVDDLQVVLERLVARDLVDLHRAFF